MIVQLILRRLGFLVFVLLGISLITFFLSHVVPADPVRLYAGPRASRRHDRRHPASIRLRSADLAAVPALHRRAFCTATSATR